MNQTEKDLLLTKFNKKIVFFPSYQHAWSQMQKSVQTTALRRSPSCAFIMGMTGAGKSTLCELFRDSFGEPFTAVEHNGIQKNIPALYVLPTAAITIKSLCEDMLSKFMERVPRLSQSELTHLLEVKIKQCNVKVIIFDEIQRLMRPDALKTKQGTLDWVVALLSHTGLPIILCGDESCQTLLEEEATKNSPFARRYCYIAILEYFSYNDDTENEYHLSLSELNKIAHSLLPIKGGVNFHDSDIKLPIYIASSGILEYIRQILNEALDICLSRAHPILQKSDFADAFHCLWLPKNLSKSGINPFEISTSECLKIIDTHTKNKQ